MLMHNIGLLYNCIMKLQVNYGTLATGNCVHDFVSDQGDDEGVNNGVSSDQECNPCVATQGETLQVEGSKRCI